MISSIEIRMPFLDYRIIEFAFSINADSKVGGGYSKRIIRDAMKNYLPKEITHRKRKIGFNSPVNSWISGEFGTWIKDTINTEDFRTSSVIDGPKSKNKIQSLLNSENLNFVDGMDVWKELVPYLWEKSLSYN
jgi:asparagine synthase (glutamine-hydrolysing)